MAFFEIWADSSVIRWAFWPTRPSTWTPTVLIPSETRKNI